MRTAKSTLRRRTALAAASLAALAATLAPAAPAAQAAAPAFQVSSIAEPTNLTPGDSSGNALLLIRAKNVGGAPTDGSPVTITDSLPAGLSVDPNGGTFYSIQISATRTQIHTTDLCTAGPPPSCSTPATASFGDSPIIRPGDEVSMVITVDVAPGLDGATLANAVTVSGGGAATVSASEQIPVSSQPAGFGPQQPVASFVDADGNPATQAGSHPYQLNLDFQTTSEPDPNTDRLRPVGSLKDAKVTLPPGVVVNPQATSTKCTEAQFESNQGDSPSCPDPTAIGNAYAWINLAGAPAPALGTPVFNMVAPPGAAAEFAFAFTAFGNEVDVHTLGGVDSAGDFQLSGAAYDLSQYVDPSGADLYLWGSPSDPSHDYRRGYCASDQAGSFDLSCPVPASDTPFLTMPSACSNQLQTTFSVDSWQDPGNFLSASADNLDSSGDPAGVDSCAALDFNPTLKARPTTTAADSPTGLSVDLHVPQTDSLNQLATSNLKKTVVTLPPGLVVNPSGANGLGACSSSQIGLTTPVGQDSPVHFSAGSPSCPDAAKVGTVEVDTPLLDHPLPGAVYIAKPFDNPFNSLIALYVVVDDPQSGVVIKLPGKVEPDPQTGQLVSSFDENPQLPFSDFKLEFFGGPQASLRTPTLCGDYSTTSELTPWSGNPPASPQDDYSISQGAGGGACSGSAAQQPNAPSFDAGTVSPIAGSYSPFVLNLSREDGSQQFSKVITSPPPGLVAKLAGTPACTEAQIAQAQGRSNPGDGATELADPSCPSDSQVGTVHVAAGAGPSPYWTTGTAYMAGPYQGEPLSLVIITPATAGPFDLGVVVTRVALHIDPATAQITATSDPIPQILQGIPLDVRAVRVALDKPDFTLNGTSCDPSAVTGSLLSSLGQSAALSQRFQLAECANLGFKPKLGLRLRGGHLRNGHPALTTVLSARGGDADIGKAQVILPPTMQLDQSHIQAPCTRPQFAADQCPAASVIGSVTATSPLLDYKLTGPVYLRTGDNPLPDVVLDLHGPASQPIRIIQVGKIDTVNARLRTTFATVPDAPISRAIIRLVGGHKGLLVNNTNLCKQANRAAVFLDAHNNKTADSNPHIALKCPQARKHHRKHKRHHRRHHLRHHRAVR